MLFLVHITVEEEPDGLVSHDHVYKIALALDDKVDVLVMFQGL